MTIHYFKNLTRITASFGLIVLILSISSCGDDPSPSASDVATQKLTAKTWKVKTVSVSDVDQTTLFNNFSIVFTATGYTSTNGGEVWPASGTWSFTDATATSIKRNDDVVVTLNELTETSLVATLTWTKTTLGPGRSSSIAGVHVFTMTP